MTAEKWLPVVGFEGWYQVSSRGRVRSVDRVITLRNGRFYRAKGRVLSPQQHPPSWVRTVTLARAGDKFNCSIHKLVEQAFPYRESGMK
jgi:hypothetical protein